MEVAQQHVEAVDGAAAFLVEVVAAVGEQPQHRGVVVAGDLAQPGVAHRHDRDRGGVDVVGLAAMAGVQQPCAGGELGGHVHNRLAGSDQLLGEQPA